jgi:hypothetical protein
MALQNVFETSPFGRGEVFTALTERGSGWFCRASVQLGF